MFTKISIAIVAYYVMMVSQPILISAWPTLLYNSGLMFFAISICVYGLRVVRFMMGWILKLLSSRNKSDKFRPIKLHSVVLKE